MKYALQQISDYVKWCYQKITDLYKTDQLDMISKIIATVILLNFILGIIYMPRILILGLVIGGTFCIYGFSKVDSED